MRIRTFLKPLSFIPALLLMYMIYSFSAQEGNISSSVSYKASCVLVKAADNIFDMGLDDYQVSYYATKINGVTRKLAHMTEYFLLAIAVSFPLYVYGLHGILLMLLAGGLCVAFACGDEYHQSFVAGRSPSVRDVGIDSFGVFVGIIIVRIIGWTGRMTLFRPTAKKDGSQNLSKKEQKRLQKQMKNTGTAYGPYPGGQSYPNGPYQNQGYPNGPYPEQGYPNGPYSGQEYPNGPYPEQGYPNGPYQNQGYPNEPYPGQGYPNGPYPEQGYPNEPYPEQGYPNGPYPEQGYPNGPYQNQGYPNGPYPGQGYPGAPYPYPPQYPPYTEPQDNHSSDELSDDMPLSHLFNPKSKH